MEETKSVQTDPEAGIVQMRRLEARLGHMEKELRDMKEVVRRLRQLATFRATLYP